MSLKASCICRLVRPVELKVSGNGTEYVHFKVAYDRGMRKKDDEWEKIVNFISGVAFGSAARYVAKLQKGSLIHIGDIEIKDSKRNDVWKTELIFNDVTGLNVKYKGKEEPSQEDPFDSGDGSDGPSNASADDDIPF